MIDLIAAAGIGGIIGFGTCALLTGGRIADEIIERMDAKDEADEARDNEAAANRKLSAIRDLLDTPRTIRKGELAAVLDGDA
jgi:hypothetical protein